ncbi:hypothetical protein EIQ06_00090 [Xanthomonas campestris pv. campestris]|uniref:Glutathione S-transferase n=1 Tax=Xanthomonas campestris pv. campestris (strain B100) TaxID=509169 RepID=B0RWX6_XANCB|nr:hypothetical protein AEA00_13760 [Xanthomonas campestris pv. campestris]AKS20893.1 hypothetical protein AEA01_13835 [Xanthomonas campestris pv. campestris]QCX67593.1 hypothetical protein DFG55_15245 [Xanthomonas campestris pv. campestris]QCX71911.1 hypothetical protein DFG54_15175 [Xanthomonas campestris pv. campestris]RFF47889.1 hypothetical protein D0A42_07960 [Xanthomonas campestris pv. campestris]
MYGVITWHERTFIAECTAITEYLDALDQRTTLSGQTAVEQGRIHMQCYGQCVAYGPHHFVDARCVGARLG